MSEDINNRLENIIKQTEVIDIADIFFSNAIYINSQKSEKHKICQNRNFKINDYVKIEFKTSFNKDYSERMWLKIIDKKSNGELSGLLQSNPVLFTKLKYNQILNFLPEHVIDCDSN